VTTCPPPPKLAEPVRSHLPTAAGLGEGPRVGLKLPADLVTEPREVYPTQVSLARPLDQHLLGDPRARSNPPDNEVFDLSPGPTARSSPCDFTRSAPR
jgi:hypothetical protein